MNAEQLDKLLEDARVVVDIAVRALAEADEVLDLTLVLDTRLPVILREL